MYEKGTLIDAKRTEVVTSSLRGRDLCPLLTINNGTQNPSNMDNLYLDTKESWMFAFLHLK